MMKTIGTIVQYRTTEEERDTFSKRPGMCEVREYLPAMIIASHNGVVNLNVQLDGHGSIWKKECEQGKEEGQWQFFGE
jgi:hypothetical protein